MSTRPYLVQRTALSTMLFRRGYFSFDFLLYLTRIFIDMCMYMWCVLCQLLLLLNCFCVVQVHKNTTRQTDGYCCCLLCMRMKSAAFDIDYRNTLYMYVCLCVLCLCFVVGFFYICATARCCLFHLFTVIVLLLDHERRRRRPYRFSLYVCVRAHKQTYICVCVCM